MINKYQTSRFTLRMIMLKISEPNRYKTKLRGLSPQANYTDRATAAVGEAVPIFAGRGCYVVSATDSHGR
jgi:hypothetical protein